jgi:hypothetical protein
MAYVIIAVIVVLAVLGVILFAVRSATKKSNVFEGETPERSKAPESPRGRFAERDDPEIARPVVGGEAEGERSAH